MTTLSEISSVTLTVQNVIS